MAKFIKVKSGLGQKPDGGYPLALHERHEDHPGEIDDKGNEVLPKGETYIADDKVHEVAPTAAVMRAIHNGALVEAGSGEKVGDSFEAPLNPDKTVSVQTGDDAEALEDRYSKEELKALAEAHGVEVKAGDTKADIAANIIDKVGE